MCVGGGWRGHHFLTTVIASEGKQRTKFMFRDGTDISTEESPLVCECMWLHETVYVLIMCILLV